MGVCAKDRKIDAAKEEIGNQRDENRDYILRQGAEQSAGYELRPGHGGAEKRGGISPERGGGRHSKTVADDF